MKSIVIFSSKTGNTEKYAKWIAEELGTKAVPANKVKVKDLKDHDTIIYGAGIYAERINGINYPAFMGDNLLGSQGYGRSLCRRG